jgi:predicted transglutaminase-like cysteine proteinase
MEKPALIRIARRSAIALALAVPSLSVSAQSYSNTSKTEAILGGQSKLAAILAQQSGQPVSVAVAPAGYGAPVLRAAMPAYRPAISADRPDVFGSVALPITRSPLDRRWRQVSRAAFAGAPALYAAGLGGRGDLAKVDAVNRYVNARVHFINDSNQYGTADRWTAASETLRRGRGDCEDYAIAKLQMLRRAGFAEKDLYLVILHDALRRADHAVLVVRAEGRMLVLDNGTDRLIDSHEMRDYRPILTFSGDRVWTHGYRREVPPVNYASNQVASPAMTFAAASVAPPVPSSMR